MSDETRIAYHEAGHAIALFVLGGDLTSVSIRAEAGARGRVRGPRFPDPSVFPGPQLLNDPDTRRVEDEYDGVVVALLAACHAEQAATGTCDSRAAAFDRREAARQAAARRASVPGYAAWAQQYAAALIQRHWPAVEALAAALAAHGEVDGEEARTIVGRALGGSAALPSPGV